ncbi:hypothetical protein QVD17_37846 [Tagetes erecta]|uniref:Uncharacterized protein n=1 Tax=Tagetes erecta TaxID=13708 RepID=A0AAD8JX54_TARER|nr:hypothetical protein QVD17_37846 [Tagetes erecta]
MSTHHILGLKKVPRQFMNEWRVFYLLESLSGSFFLELIATGGEEIESTASNASSDKVFFLFMDYNDLKLAISGFHAHGLPYYSFFDSSGMPAKRIASRLACKSISSSILTLYEIELFQFMRESALVE